MRVKKKIINISALGILIVSNLYAGDTVSVGVVYPDMREPYKTVFSNIIDGIKETQGLSVREYAFDDADSQEELNGWLSAAEMNSVIVLGRQGVSKTKNLPEGVYPIVGAVLHPPDAQGKASGIALSPSPLILFSRLKKLAPAVESITVIYNDAISGWLIPYAESAAQKNKLSFKAVQAKDIREAATLYRDLIQTGLDSRHAVWLPHDGVTADPKVILPYILKQSWERNFIVFSSNPSYVSRGVLFSLYPDNIGMGRSLGKLALNEPSLKKPVIQPLNDLMIAVNIRTAEHLGLRISASDKRGFDLVFPPSR